MRSVLTLALAALPVMPLHALSSDGDALEQKIEAILATAPAGTRYGLMVTDEDGTQIIAIAPDQRFIPASNTKMFTTATAYARLAEVDAAGRGTAVALEKGRKGLSVVLLGRGDARLSSAADCQQDCLATLADAIAAKTRKVRDVIGDDRWFPDERWSPGMSWNNIPTRSGTGISALTLDDNELAAMVAPGAVGEAPRIDGLSYYALDNRALTVPGKEVHLQDWRDPMSMTVRVTGTIGVDAPAERLRFGIDDPAHYAAWRLAEMLKARGVKVKGEVLSRHRPLLPQDDPRVRGEAVVALPAEPEPLAQLPALPVAGDVTIINKVSQNLHAELLLRRVGRLTGSGSIADGQVALRAVMAQARLPDASYDLSDGSGMSSYNRISPRGAVTLLRWVAAQHWGADWRATLPVGGVDGTLRRRFGGTALADRLFAKTGSLNASNALSGYMVAKSGRTLIFSIISNDCPDVETDKAVAAMDQALLAIAEAE
ncbi:D-alanyl-D-alanine carboxypeptidase/D-alanyl-D-alanine endopeptidase [Sphingobium nicotianae]|uniref:D-alanyl-D-alanine carboxypeptidase/D-alanyl-D-alanine-endopeptidase n=1 Tax=Sphingobium nicotianae TaxID=2782607 RepID=A0A9X1DFC2_9SPHN|nr:D-alanyl-D-alanine carboxypeptidase/D-alanyl-D-alanine-endopeptidase [Sphingobium nicotianae]MBT2188839.1 D-alanyl-D-alanine carboxypeptidase/D-alanyl-D-alanine-endopeptidase [Sphingobium nicotianae]